MTPSITLAASTPTHSAKRVAGFLIGGGALWIAYYALQIPMGLSTGRGSMTGPLAIIDGACFSGAIVSICAGLGTFAWSVRERAKTLSAFSLGFALIAACCMLWGFVSAIMNNQPPGIWGGIGVIGSCLSAIFCALAAKRAKAIAARISTFLLLTGLLTFPVICLFGMIANKWVPPVWTEELPFALVGAAYIAFARKLLK